MESLLSLMSSGNHGAMMTAAEALISGSSDLEQGDVQMVFDALLTAGDRKDSHSIVELLKVVAALKSKASGFEGFVLAFTDYPSESVRREAQNALNMIRS